MSRLRRCFPGDAEFGRDDTGELLIWWTDGSGDRLCKPVSAWVDEFTVAGTSYDVIESFGGAVRAFLIPPIGGVSNGPVVGRRFRLWRHEDVSGVSGTGVVAHGVQWPDGAVALRWSVPGLPPSSAVWDDISAVEAVHGHQGKTEVEWID